ncbi:hypothetical protein ACWFNE_19825, partial [Cellulomonas sp. NPDC055163]
MRSPAGGVRVEDDAARGAELRSGATTGLAARAAVRGTDVRGEGARGAGVRRAESSGRVERGTLPLRPAASGVASPVEVRGTEVRAAGVG